MNNMNFTKAIKTTVIAVGLTTSLSSLARGNIIETKSHNFEKTKVLSTLQRKDTSTMSHGVNEKVNESLVIFLALATAVSASVLYGKMIISLGEKTKQGYY